jgi:aspartate carbamoyltransferase regulatory subunit
MGLNEVVMNYRIFQLFSTACIGLIVFGACFRYQPEYARANDYVPLEEVLTKQELHEIKSLLPDRTVTDIEIKNAIKKIVPNIPSQQRNVAQGKGTEFANHPEGYYELRNRFNVRGPLAIDNQTGLMWMRCASGFEYKDGSCEELPYGIENKTAIAALAEKNLYGYNDWRIASEREVSQILLFTDRRIDVVFPVFLSSLPLYGVSDGKAPNVLTPLYKKKGAARKRLSNVLFVRGGGV